VKVRSSHVCIMKMYVGVEVQLHPFLTSLPRWMCEVTMRWSLYFQRKSSGGWMGSRANVHALGVSKVSFPWQKSADSSLAVNLIACSIDYTLLASPRYRMFHCCILQCIVISRHVNTYSVCYVIVTHETV